MGKSSIALLCFHLLSLGTSNAEESSAAKFHLASSDDFASEKCSVFVMNNRAVGPFGKPQDPHKKIVKPEARALETAKPTITKKEQQILIEEEITKLGKKLNVLGRRVIIGSKTYTRGDKINVSVKGKVFPLKFNSITSSKVTFLDLTDKSIISLDMNNRVVIPTGDNNHGLESGKTDTHKIEE